MSLIPSSVKIMEVGPRDGLQNENGLIETEKKVEFIEGLFAAGMKRVELTAFVSPKWIPSLADSLAVFELVKCPEGATRAALVPNVVGYERAMKAGADEVSIVLSATQSHNQKNINASTEEALGRYVEISKLASKDKIPLRAYISCAFGCPYEGKVPALQVKEVAMKLLDLGVYELSIGDTIGASDPLQVRSLIRVLADGIPKDKIALHLHDTMGLALANIFVALEEGISSFDSSAGGLGGCPYAPGASGNVASEDLVHMLDVLGIESGVKLAKLAEVSLAMEKNLARTLPSKVLATFRP